MLTSPKGQYILDAQLLGSVQVCSYAFLGKITAGDVEHGFNATVVQHTAGNGSGAGGLVGSRVSSRMPCHITEQWTT